jgi:hypothetical protein
MRIRTEKHREKKREKKKKKETEKVHTWEQR